MLVGRELESAKLAAALSAARHGSGSALGLLTAAAEDAPVLIVVDDLQWVDSASRAALSFASRRLAGIPALLVVAQRAGATHPPDLQVVQIGPLDREEASQVLAEHAGRIAPDVVARILDAARGNPLALVELPHLLTAGQLAGTEALASPIPTANGLERAFAARLAPLSGRGRLPSVVSAADTSRTAGVVLDAFGPLGLAE